MQRGRPLKEVIDKDTNQPHLVRVVAVDDEELPIQYFIVIEQVVHLEVSSIVKSIFLLLAFHYVYDIQYNHRLKDLFLLFEDKLLAMSTTSCKKSPTYLNVSSSIACYL